MLLLILLLFLAQLMTTKWAFILTIRICQLPVLTNSYPSLIYVILPRPWLYKHLNKHDDLQENKTYLLVVLPAGDPIFNIFELTAVAKATA